MLIVAEIKKTLFKAAKFECFRWLNENGRETKLSNWQIHIVYVSLESYGF